MDFRILGPLEVRDGDREVRLRGGKQRALLALLLVHANRTLASDRSETVRGWVAVNYYVPADVMDKLAKDRSRTVRSLVKWKAQLAEDEGTAEEAAPERAGEPALRP